MPTVLNSLLSHLVHFPCTNSTLRLLSIVDSVLQTSYLCITERKTWALECLRLIAKRISQALDSEIIRIIAVMPYGLCKWIADEDLVLTDFEHREVVSQPIVRETRLLILFSPGSLYLRRVSQETVCYRTDSGSPLCSCKFPAFGVCTRSE